MAIAGFECFEAASFSVVGRTAWDVCYYLLEYLVVIVRRGGRVYVL